MTRRTAKIVIMSALVELFGCAPPPLAPPPAAEPQPQPRPLLQPQGETQPAPSPPIALRTDIVVTGGVHGNEPSGAAVLAELAAAGLQTFGPCNPWGLAHGSRHLEDGRDLNRSFAKTGVPEVDAVKSFLEARRPALLLDLHEDRYATGAYLIQHGPDDDLGHRIVAELDDEIAFEPKPHFNVLEGEGGVLKPGEIVLAAVELSRFYGLAFYAWRTYGCTTFVVEVPHRWPLEKRKHTHRRIVETARRLFSQDNPL